MQDRQHTRLMAAVGVVLTAGSDKITCMTRDISRGGLFVVTPKRLEVGTQVQLRIVAQGKPLACAAQVTQVADDGMGLAFVDIDSTFENAIDDLAQSLLRAGGGAAGASAAAEAETAPSTRHAHVEAAVAWTHLPDGKQWNWWRKGLHHAKLNDLSLDGANLVASRRAEVGEMLIIFLGPDGTDPAEGETCRAEVVRHTERGFAVQFLSPRVEFRQLVSKLRAGDDS